MCDAYVVAHGKPFYLVRSYLRGDEQEEEGAEEAGEEEEEAAAAAAAAATVEEAIGQRTPNLVRGKKTLYFDAHPVCLGQFKHSSLPWEDVGVWR